MWMDSSGRMMDIWLTNRVERRGQGNDANVAVDEVVLVELMWWKEGMR